MIDGIDFMKLRHIKFLSRFLNCTPYALRVTDTTRPTLTYFIISGLDLLKSLDEVLTDENKKRICDWIYSLQRVPTIGKEDDPEELKKCGFQGSVPISVQNEYVFEYNAGHLAATYSSLCVLLILGDNFTRLDKNAILKSLTYLQSENGSFQSCTIDGEIDMRFVYCAAAICYILNDWSYIDVDKAVNFILNAISYDGAIGQDKMSESHGGSTFCGVAALSLMGKLNDMSSKQIKLLQRWLLSRQQTGFQGRPNKEVDTCYSYWIGATLKLLGAFDYVNWDENRKYLMNTQNSIVGGFSKWIGTDVDVLHTYFGIGGLSLMKEDGLETIIPALNISQRAFDHMIKLHEKWK